MQPLKNNWKAYIIPDKNDYSPVMLVDNKTCKMSLASLDEESLHDIEGGSGATSATSLGSGYEEGNILDNSKQGQVLDSKCTDDKSANDSLKTETVLIDSEADREEEEELEAISPYDCPHNITVTTKGS